MYMFVFLFVYRARRNKRIFLLNFYSCKCAGGQIHEQVKLLPRGKGTPASQWEAARARCCSPVPIHWPAGCVILAPASANGVGLLLRGPASSAGRGPPARTVAMRFSPSLTLRGSSCYVSDYALALEKAPFPFISLEVVGRSPGAESCD